GTQRSVKDKTGLGLNEYTVVPPPPAQVYSPPKNDLSWTGLPEFVDDTVTDYSRPTPSIDCCSQTWILCLSSGKSSSSGNLGSGRDTLTVGNISSSGNHITSSGNALAFYSQQLQLLLEQNSF
ncbi:hypothetical protein Tco_0805811, partial [Tanacetum coccineum]